MATDGLSLTVSFDSERALRDPLVRLALILPGAVGTLALKWRLGRYLSIAEAKG